MQTNDPINTIPIQQFIQQVKTADAGNQKEIKIPLAQAKALVFSLSTVMANQTGRLEKLIIDKAQLMTLTAPEMTVLIGGMMVLNTNFDGSNYGVFTKKVGTLTNDYFKNLLDMNITWSDKDDKEQYFQGKNRKTNKVIWEGSRVDLIFGSNSQLRAIAEVYASDDSNAKFIKDFSKVWSKVMNLDRFDKKIN